MTNEKINQNRRWRRFAELNGDSYFCTHKLMRWAENGSLKGYYDPERYISQYKRDNCGRCNKCDQINTQAENEITDPEYWKRKAFDLAKAYGQSLKHLDELKIENVTLKAENRMLFDIIKMGGD